MTSVMWKALLVVMKQRTSAKLCSSSSTQNLFSGIFKLVVLVLWNQNHFTVSPLLFPAVGGSCFQQIFSKLSGKQQTADKVSEQLAGENRS